MNSFKAVAHAYQDALMPLYGTEESKQLFLMTYTAITGKSAVHYKLNHDRAITEPALEKFLNILKQLQTGRPIQYILGIADFCGMRLSVNEHVLIPRPETEELVAWVVNEHQDRQALSILDVGTGSGCIALALKKFLPHAQVDAIDIAVETIQVARHNASDLNLPINFIQADVLEWDSFMQASQQYDVIVSNPPYITPDEQKDMHRNVLLHEPHRALFVEEHAPLLFYDAIADLGKKHLLPGGALYVEINQYLAPDTVSLFEKKGYDNTVLRQDLNQVDRMIKANNYFDEKQLFNAQNAK